MSRPLLFASLTFLFLPSLSPARAADLPPDSAYVRPEGEHLVLEGQPVRFWGFIGPIGANGFKWAPAPAADDDPEVRAKKVEDIHHSIDFYVDRIAALGFNLVRTWERPEDCVWDAPYQAGDGSPLDQIAYYWAALDRKGIKQWCTFSNHLGIVTAADAEKLAPGPEGKPFRDAIAEFSGVRAGQTKGKAKGRVELTVRSAYPEFWDERLQQVRLDRLTRAANFRNHYKPGAPRIADDPQVAVWELSNEEWWMKKMLTGKWHELPDYFQQSLLARWQDFLRQRYADDAGLEKAWGNLFPGESLAEGTVQLAPLAPESKQKEIGDASEEARQALLSGAADQGITLANPARGADVVEFFTTMHLAWKKKLYDHVKALGRSCQLASVVMDTGEGYRSQSILLHQQGDAATFCTYLQGRAREVDAPRSPWYSYLEDPPLCANGVPWVEGGSIAGKPMFWYETNTLQPGKYRAEFPYQAVALASLQDTSIVCWHTFPRPVDPNQPNPWDGPLYNSTASAGALGFEYRHDEVLISGIVNAGIIFRNHELVPAKNPTVLTWGRPAIYDPQSMAYGSSFGKEGEKIAPTAYSHGLRMRVDLDQPEFVKANGPVVTPDELKSPLRPTPELEYDWTKGHLFFDAPAAIGYTGFFAKHGGPVRFPGADATLDRIQIANPPGLFDPMREDERFIAFSAVAEDGQPLATSARIRVALECTSFNMRFQLNKETIATRDWNGKGNIKSGQVPVLVARAAGTLTAPWLEGMRYRLVDFHLRELKEGELATGELEIPNNLPVFAIELER